MITALQTWTLVLLGRIAVGPTTCVDAVYCYRPSSVVCRSVCLSVCHTSPAKMAEPIEMPFAFWARMGPGNHELDGSPQVLKDVAMATNFWLSMGYNFDCMIASDTLFDSRGQAIQ